MGPRKRIAEPSRFVVEAACSEYTEWITAKVAVLSSVALIF